MVVALLIIIIYAISIGIISKKKTVECLPISIFSITFIIYIFGILNLFMIGITIIGILTLFGLGLIIYTIINHKNERLKLLDVGTIVFIILVILMFNIVKDSKVLCYDEFTAWGMFTKNSFESKSLYIYSDFQALAKNYASGTSIFQTFVQLCNYRFSEDLMFVAMNMIFYAMAVNVLKKQKAKQIIENIFLGIMILLIPLSIYMWPAFYYTVLVDVIIGFVAAYILFTYFTSGIDKFNFINISLALFFLTCTKANGLLLALICLAIIYGDMLFFKKKDWFQYLQIKSFREIFDKKKIKSVLILILPILSTIFTFLSWNVCIKILNISSYSSSELGGIITSIFGEQFKERLPHFLETAKALYMEYKSFLLLCGALGITLVARSFKGNKKRILRVTIVGIVFLLLNCIYIFFLFSVCNTMVTIEIAVEALRRYLLTLVAIYVLGITSFLTYFFTKETKLNVAIILVAIIYITTPASWQTKKFIEKGYTKESIEYREKYTTIQEKLENVDVNKDVVYYIKEIESDIYLSNFAVFPYQLSHMPGYTEEMSIEEYSANILNRSHIEICNIYTDRERSKLEQKKTGDIYVYVYKVTELNQQLYGKIFEYNNIPMQDETLYRVNNQDGIAILTIVQ